MRYYEHKKPLNFLMSFLLDFQGLQPDTLLPFLHFLKILNENIWTENFYRETKIAKKTALLFTVVRVFRINNSIFS